MKEIYLICNSEQALNEISSGRFPDLDKKDLFTCNNAYTFFRTTGRHLNFWTDTEDIIRNVIMPETLSKDYQKKVDHIYSLFGRELKNGNTLYRWLKFSPVRKAGSSALNAISYLNMCEKYDVIWLIGYTLDESDNDLWSDFYKTHRQEINGAMSPNTHKFLRK